TAVYVQRDTLLTLQSISRSLWLLWKEFSNGKQQSDDCDHRKGGVDNAGVRTFRWIEQDGCQCECRSKKPHGKPCPAIPMTDSKVGDDEREQRQTGEAHIQKLLVQHIGVGDTGIGCRKFLPCDTCVLLKLTCVIRDSRDNQNVHHEQDTQQEQDDPGIFLIGFFLRLMCSHHGNISLSSPVKA